MVRSQVCPQCLNDMGSSCEYVEEGDTMASTGKIVCPHCGFTLDGIVSGCAENSPMYDGEAF